MLESWFLQISASCAELIYNTDFYTSWDKKREKRIKLNRFKTMGYWRIYFFVPLALCEAVGGGLT